MSGEEDKMKAAEIILKHSYYYKFCECCESVILYTQTFCPMCDGYRFNENLSVVIEAVKKLAKKSKTKILPSFDIDELDDLI